MRDYKIKNSVQLDDNIADRVLTLAASAATEEDEDTLEIFREAVSQSRDTKNDLNEEYRRLMSGTLDVPSATLERLLANDPSGRSLWLLESDLKRATRFLLHLSTSLGYRDMGALAQQGQHLAWDLLVVCELLLEEFKMFRRRTEMPSGYLPRWNHEVRNGCKKCPCEAADGLLVCMHCSENKPCEPVGANAS